MPPILGVNQAGFETEQKAAELIFTRHIFFFTVVSSQLKKKRSTQYVFTRASV